MLIDIPLLPSGTHTDANGSVDGYEEADLQLIADSYNPSLHSASVVLGHSGDAEFMQGHMPKDDGPAYGWAKALYVRNGVLHGLVDFADECVDWVKRKLYDYRSVGLYDTESPYNPVPGVPYLRHIALLGASPPAIKGLPQLSTLFSEAVVQGMVITYTEDLGAKTDMANYEELQAAADAGDETAMAQLQEMAADGDEQAMAYCEAKGVAYGGEKPKAMAEEDEMAAPDGVEAEMPAEDAESASDDADGPGSGDEAVAFLNENAEAYLRQILTDGESGYAGEIERFEPEPSQENNWLMSDSGAFSGKFFDASLGEDEAFNFEAKQEGDNWSISFWPEGSSADDADAEEVEMEAEAEEDVAPPASDEAAEGETPEDEPVAMGEKADPKLKAYAERIAKLEAKLDRDEQRQVNERITKLYSEGILTNELVDQKRLKRLAEYVRKPQKAVKLYGESEDNSPALEELFAIFDVLPKAVQFGKQYAEAMLAPAKPKQYDGPKAPRGVAYSEDGMQMDQAIRAYMEEHSITDYRQGMRAYAQSVEQD